MEARLAKTAIPAGEGKRLDFGGWGVIFKIDGSETGGRFSVIEHPIAPRSLVAALHRHTNEDEYSYVLEGTIGVLLGDEVVEASAETWVFKPRGQWHTFWNPSDEPARVLEVISPAGFEQLFRDIAESFAADPPDYERISSLPASYALDWDEDSIPALCERFSVSYTR
jgi:mannose-6-phosphate isomerase-like protein (cupin superfamily)